MAMEPLDRDGIEKILREIDDCLPSRKDENGNQKKIPIYLNKLCSKAFRRKRAGALALEFYAGEDGNLDISSRCALHRAIINVEGNLFIRINEDAKQPKNEDAKPPGGEYEEKLVLNLKHLEVYAIYKLNAGKKLISYLKPPYHPIDSVCRMVRDVVHSYSGS